MESTFLWQANLKSAMMNVGNLRTIFVSQLTSSFQLSFLSSVQCKFNLFSKQNPVLMATAIVYPWCFAVLLSVSPMLLRKSNGSVRSISDTFLSPNNTANTLVQQESKQVSAFSQKVIRHRCSSGTNRGTINKWQSNWFLFCCKINIIPSYD